ncbi:MAG: hypothetical protein JXR96_25860 [Deltaproteobacteria bacterium]|nr:hypothetical protein [Deltaproteobacteria bacterium]
MPERDDDEYAIGQVSEMQARFGWTAESWQGPSLRDERVPDRLRDLLPLARRWGVTCDVTRHDVADKASRAELAELAAGLRGRHCEIEDWLYSPDDGSDDERAAFQAMVVLEAEACDGPGLAGLLGWAIRWYRDRPCAERRERLAAAYREVLGWGELPHLAEDLRAARELLGGERGD